jgi:hypothetical protein
MSVQPQVLGIVLGKPKRGKTSDMLAAFPGALFLGVPGAITLVAQNELGFSPAVYGQPPQTLDDLLSVLGSIDPAQLSEDYGAVVIDDASHIARRSMLQWELEAPKGRSGKPDRFYPYQQLGKRLLELTGLARHIGSHLMMTFHERPPSVSPDGTFTSGGPDVPSRNQVEILPSWCDITVRAIIDKESIDPWFPNAYACDPRDPEWVTGCRVLNSMNTQMPANMREILRASETDYRLDRITGLDWQDELADEIAGRMTQETVKGIVADIAAKHSQYAPLHIRWACRDGIARGVLNRQLSRSLFDFPEETTPTNGSGRPVLPPPPPPTK